MKYRFVFSALVVIVLSVLYLMFDTDKTSTESNPQSPNSSATFNLGG